MNTQPNHSKDVHRTPLQSGAESESVYRKYVLTLRRVMVPIDFSDYSVKALHYATAFAQQFGAALVLVHVTEPTVFPSELGYGPLATEVIEQHIRQDAQARLNSLAQQCIACGLKVETGVRVGRPYNEIVKAAEEHDVDLIIIATHGFTGLTHVLLGSTAERVVRHARCPVLVVRENEREFVTIVPAQKEAAPQHRPETSAAQQS